MQNIVIKATGTVHACTSGHKRGYKAVDINPGTYTLQCAYIHDNIIVGYCPQITRTEYIEIHRSYNERFAVVELYDEPYLGVQDFKRHKELSLSKKTDDMLKRFPLRLIADPMWRYEVCQARKRVALKRFLDAHNCRIHPDTSTDILQIIAKRIQSGLIK